jgi:hypothetical protein
MTRNLKILGAAALALAAFGAFGAPGAQATDELHCSINPCKFAAKQDGTGTTAHQVFIVENAAKTEQVSFTCHQVSAEADGAVSATNELTATNIQYSTCTVNGSPGVVVDMNGCDYRFTRGAVGNDAAGTSDGAEVHVECPTGKQIQVTIPEIGCTFEIGPQTLSGIGYQSIGTTPNREITATAKNVGNIAVTRNAGCAALIKAEALTGTYTTGNVVATGQTPPAGTMVDAWFA